MYGASPPISTHFRHASTIDAINRMGFAVGTVGNHEFDDGGDELARVLPYAELCAIEANGHPVMRMRMRGRYLRELLGSSGRAVPRASTRAACRASSTRTASTPSPPTS